MIGAAMVRAIEKAERDSEELTRALAEYFTFRVAAEVLSRDSIDGRIYERALEQIERSHDMTVRRELPRILAVANGTEFVSDWRTELVARMTDYGHLLRTDGRSAQAADAFGYAARARGAVPAARMAAIRGRAWALRQIGDPFRAERAYNELRSFAEDSCDILMEMEADIGRATVMVESNRLPAAEALTLEILGRATRIGAITTISRAHANLACIAGIGERYDEAIIHAREAMRGPLSRLDRDICVSNIAFAFRKLRCYRAAERYAASVARSAEGAEQRAAALLTLAHIALDRGESAAYYINRIDPARISVATHADLHEVTAREYWLSDDSESARHELAEGLLFAEKHGLNRAVIDFDTALLEMEGGEMPRLFHSPTYTIPLNTASALRTIEAEAWNADAVNSFESRRGAVGIRLTPTAHDDEAALTDKIIPILTGSS